MEGLDGLGMYEGKESTEKLRRRLVGFLDGGDKMFLISEIRLRPGAKKKSKGDETSPYLLINDYWRQIHKQTFYKFRYSARK